MRTLSFPSTQAARNCAASAEIDPNVIRSFIVYGSRENFRIVSVGPLRASGGMIAFTREPSGRRASTIGELSSMRRPTLDTTRSMICSRWASSRKITGVSSSLPSRSTYTWRAVLTRMSETSGSRINGSIGPRPWTSWRISAPSCSRSRWLSGTACSSISCLTTPPSSALARARSTWARLPRSMRSSSSRCMRSLRSWSVRSNVPQRAGVAARGAGSRAGAGGSGFRPSPMRSLSFMSVGPS